MACEILDTAGIEGCDDCTARIGPNRNQNKTGRHLVDAGLRDVRRRVDART
jgi:hypothetical protein